MLLNKVQAEAKFWQSWSGQNSRVYCIGEIFRFRFWWG